MCHQIKMTFFIIISFFYNFFLSNPAKVYRIVEHPPWLLHLAQGLFVLTKHVYLLNGVANTKLKFLFFNSIFNLLKQLTKWMLIRSKNCICRRIYEALRHSGVHPVKETVVKMADYSRRSALMCAGLWYKRDKTWQKHVFGHPGNSIPLCYCCL